MNLLAHIYLSGSSEEIIAGNFIGDAVKGRYYDGYPKLIQQGIRLHRHIDSFTDTHSVVHKSKFLFNSIYGHYSGVVIDIFYDYFLSENWERFSPISRERFIYNSYEILLRNSKYFPVEVKRYFPFFILRSWLETYSTMEGLHKVLSGMSIRTSLPDMANSAIELLKNNYSTLNDHFLEFFPEMIQSARKKFNILLPEIEEEERFLPSA